LFDELPIDTAARDRPRFPDRPPVIGLLPGSRKSEAAANFPHQLDVATRVLRHFPGARFLVPTTAATETVVRDCITRSGIARTRGLTGASPGASPQKTADSSSSSSSSSMVGDAQPISQVIQHARDAFDTLVQQCDLCITVSGTATLHVAALNVPMIVVYRGNPVLWHLLGRWIVRTRTYSLVNLLSDFHERIVPEFIPWYGSNEPIAAQAIDMLKQPGKLEEQRQRLRHLVKTLDKPGASMNVAKMAVEMMNGGLSRAGNSRSAA
jgi:lipid-A-disaccharide synthase